MAYIWLVSTQHNIFCFRSNVCKYFFHTLICALKERDIPAILGRPLLYGRDDLKVWCENDRWCIVFVVFQLDDMQDTHKAEIILKEEEQELELANLHNHQEQRFIGEQHT